MNFSLAPVHDFSTHARLPWQTTLVSPAPLVLVDGILLLTDPSLAAAFDVRICVDTTADIRLLRRIRRDVEEWGREVARVLDQYEGTVRPMHELYVEPSRARADYVVSGMESASVAPLIDALVSAVSRRMNPSEL